MVTAIEPQHQHRQTDGHPAHLTYAAGRHTHTRQFATQFKYSTIKCRAFSIVFDDAKSVSTFKPHFEFSFRYDDKTILYFLDFRNVVVWRRRLPPHAENYSEAEVEAEGEA